jgi:paraquat-inducible protein B
MDRKSRFNIIWIVPVIAGVIAAWLVYKNVREAGPTITIRFADGKGIQAGHAVLRYRGIRVGEVRSIGLAKGMRAVEIKVRLVKSAANLAREGALFWIVNADVSAGSFSGLDTIVGGPYIEAEPGNGPEKKEFTGIEQGPVVQLQDAGLDVTLSWPQLGWLNPGAPLYYRGVEVGVVRDYSLGEHATNIIIHAHIHQRFAPLVREDTQFWNAGGIKADFSLFGGISVSAETLKSLFVGGIAFATPSPPGKLATEDMVFPLYEKPKDKWLKWSPDIVLSPATNSDSPPAPMNLNPIAPVTPQVSSANSSSF